jgi:membrane-associated phospholipid phosphatase
MPLSSLKSKKFLWIVPPLFFWLGLYLLRPITIKPWCAVQPTPCTTESVNAFDRIVFGHHSVFCDFLSNVVQNGMAVVFILLPVIFIRKTAKLILLESYILAGVFWNGTLLEVTRIFAERPRPLVMNDPMGDGSRVVQYTSFYSGHTSFVAYAALISVLWMNHSELTRARFGKLAWFLYPTLVILTATLRVLAGRHYPTDTICGAIAGSLVAWFTFKRYQANHSLDSI